MEERRNALWRYVAALIGAALVAGVAACELPAGTRVEANGVALSFHTVPERVTLGEHFVVEFAACAKDGGRAVAAIAVDAWMPEHRHGMNYRPSVTALGGGRFRAEGLLFHMPGRWEFVFQTGGTRLTHSVRVD